MSQYWLARGPFEEEELASLLILPDDSWRLYDRKLDRLPEPVPLPAALDAELSGVLWTSETYLPARSLASSDYGLLCCCGAWDGLEPEQWVRCYAELVRYHLEDQKRQFYLLARCVERYPDDIDFEVGMFFWILYTGRLRTGEHGVWCLDLYGTPCIRPEGFFELDSQALGRLKSSFFIPRRRGDILQNARKIHRRSNLSMPPPRE